MIVAPNLRDRTYSCETYTYEECFLPAQRSSPNNLPHFLFYLHLIMKAFILLAAAILCSAEANPYYRIQTAPIEKPAVPTGLTNEGVCQQLLDFLNQD